ncbi:MAG: T9SS type A sorting domain-containing protein [Candidatus Cloacimonetes bacterium]|nr:T9SS type A sorting domain-containing protein [Candidatus Cloacimonadota bacterium]
MRRVLLLLVLLIMSSVIWSETVYDIQYTTDPSGDSPLAGQIVTVSGIVTATNWYVSGNANRFFISDPEGGEWHGIFVFNYDFEVELGDEVELTAEVSEYFGFTELTNLTELTVLSSGNPVPEPLEVTTLAVSGTEAYESVLVQVNDVVVTVGPNNYGEAFIDDGSGECQTDDAMYSYEPVAGNEYQYIIGIVDYSYDEYGLNPRSAMDVAVAGEPGYIEGMVELDGGAGNVEDAIVSAAGHTASPNEYGEYDMELPPGTYNVTASLAGYSPMTLTDVLVEEDETTSGIDFTLTPSAEVTIYDIQYTEDISGDSPYTSQVVTVSGIVSGADFGGNNFFFITSEEGGAWNGLYVYQYDVVVAQGDNVTITGEISEYFGFTELGSISEIVINSSGNALPAAVEVTTAEVASEEAYESVLVKVNNVSVTELPNEYNEWLVDDGSGDCQVDDGFGFIYPDLAIDDQFVSITGIIDYSFDTYGLHPRSMADFNTGGNPEFTPIYDIQYTEDASGDSPLAGQSVTVEALVTGVGYSGGIGYFLTNEGGAWDGIYVYDSENSPARGDLVRLTAEVSEYFGYTELGDVTDFQIISSGNALPTYPSITTQELATEEAYEGVYVAIHNVTITQESNDYGEWFVDDGSGECQIDDGFGVTFPELQIGDEISHIYGLVDYSFSEYGLNPQFDYEIDYGQDNDENIVTVVDLKAYPNPFRAAGERSVINFSYTLENASELELAVYNIRGQKIAQLAEGMQPAGTYQISWNGRDTAGAALPAGIYLYQLRAEGIAKSAKILLLK